MPLQNEKYTGSPVIRTAKPKVFIPVFPGTNCEIDTKRAFEKAGAETEILVVQNLTAKDIEYTIDRMEKAIERLEMQDNRIHFIWLNEDKEVTPYVSLNQASLM